MSTPAKSRRPDKSSARSRPTPTQETPDQPNFLDRLAEIRLHFGRFGWDIGGVIFLVIALITLLGLLGWTRGALVSPWVEGLKRGFGWGSYLVVVFFGLLGTLLLRRHWGPLSGLSIGRLIALEGFLFVILAILAISGSMAIEPAEAGKYGGTVGWGLARMLTLWMPLPLATILFTLLGIILGVFGFGLDKPLTKLMLGWTNLDVDELPGDTEPDARTDIREIGHSPEQVASQSPHRPQVRPGRQLAPDENPPTTSGARVPVLPAENDPAEVVSAPLDDSKPAKQRSKKLPPLTLLSGDAPSTVQEQDIILMARKIEKTLSEFGVDVRVAGYRAGPTVIQFAVEPGTYEKTGPDGLPQLLKYKVSQINDLRKDLALALAARTLRIVPVVPGQSFLGIEVPNPQTSIVHLRTVMDSEVFKAVHSPLAIALGRDVAGKPVAFDLAKMPHLLIGGTTGSGKSVAIAAMATCLLMNNNPEDLRIAMLDPKMVELVRFNGVPHLMGKVETKVERMLNVLRWALVEMEHRLRIMEAEHARDLDTYNRKMVQKGSVKLPRVVVMIDELAELMQHAPEQTESSLVRLAQMARAVGIHLVVATQRPSTDVVTGKIKTNFPARIAFTVASGVDSRVIIDQNGAEDLLGKGDCLFMSPDAAGLTRVQGVFVSDKELDAVVGFWQNAQKDEPKESAPWEEIKSEEKSENGFDEALIQKAIEVVRRSQRASASMLQMRLRIGFPRASRLLDLLEEMGIVGPAVGSGREREVLISEEESEDGDDAPEE